MNCWEYMNCGFGPNHATKEESSSCPTSQIEHFNGCNGGLNAGRACWMIAETRCKGKIQGSYLDKIKECTECDFYNFIAAEGKGFFVLGKKSTLLPDDTRQIYKDTTIASKIEDEQTILYLLRQLNMNKQYKEVSLLTFYKEIPVSNKAEIIEIRGSKVTLSTNELQLAAIRSSGEAFIGLNPFAKTFKCIPVDYGLNTPTITVSNFSFVNLFNNFRDALRVRLQRPLNVVMRKDNNIISGTILDISISGCGMNVLTVYGLDTANEVNLKLKLINPGTYQPMDADIPCVIASVDNVNRPYKVALKFIHDKHTEEVVSRFVYQRQVDIVREMKETWQPEKARSL